MPNKILIAYASQTDSTGGVAEAIVKTLAESSAPVEVRLMKEVQDLTPYRALVRPVSEGLFAGALDVSKIPSFGDRLRFRLSVAFGVWSEGDHRDWNAIHAWAGGLRSLLLQ